MEQLGCCNPCMENESNINATKSLGLTMLIYSQTDILHKGLKKILVMCTPHIVIIKPKWYNRKLLYHLHNTKWCIHQNILLLLLFQPIFFVAQMLCGDKTGADLCYSPRPSGLHPSLCPSCLHVPCGQTAWKHGLFYPLTHSRTSAL